MGSQFLGIPTGYKKKLTLKITAILRKSSHFWPQQDPGGTTHNSEDTLPSSGHILSTKLVVKAHILTFCHSHLVGNMGPIQNLWGLWAQQCAPVKTEYF